MLHSCLRIGRILLGLKSSRGYIHEVLTLAIKLGGSYLFLRYNFSFITYRFASYTPNYMLLIKWKSWLQYHLHKI